MFHSRSSRFILTFSVLSGLLLVGFFSTYANVDLGTWQQACTIYRNHTEPVTNGSCSGRQKGEGTQTVHGLINDEGERHDEYGECVNGGNWEWVTKVCTPTYTCLDNPDVDLTNASFVSVHEQPYENAPVGLNVDPIFPLAQDFLKDIVFADNVAVSETANGCEYTCNDGYRLSTGPCSATTISSISCTSAPAITVSDPTGTVDGTQATATYVAPSPANSLSGVSDAIITEAGSGYNGDPIVSFTGGNCNFYPNAKATADLATGKITSVHLEAKGNKATATVNTSGTITLNAGGSGYVTAPTVTAIPASGCTGSLAATINTATHTVDTVTITGGTCTTGTLIDIAEPTGISSCTTPPTLVIPPPTGTTAPVKAVIDAVLSGTTVTLSITNPGSGYLTAPTLTISGGGCTPASVSATATIADGKVTGVSLSASGTTAVAVSNVAGTLATITNPGSGYTATPLVTVTSPTATPVCTTLPVATATLSASGTVSGITLTGAVGCNGPEKPVLTIAAPTVSTCSGTGDVKKCIANVCTGDIPSNATYCENDTTIAGHEDQPNVHRSDVSQCTSNAKCEWFCPVDNPYFCEEQNTCVPTQNDCGNTNTCKTSAPSELKTETDYPLIQCDAINTTSTHFRYKITKTGGTSSDTYISPLFTVGTSVKHPTTFYAGTYTVTCLYGTASNTNDTLPDYGMTPDNTCNKTMTVNDTANGCSRLYPYRGSTLSDSLASSSAFDASFRCGSRAPTANTSDTKAYRLQIGTSTPAFLAYDRIISDLFNNLTIGPVSTQTQNYNFSSGTDVSCAVKVGDGYSTNTSCQARACVGSTCSDPQTFIVVPSEEISCTNTDNISYDVGCNAASPDYTQCLKWIYEGTGTTRNVKVRINGVEEDRYFTCTTSTPPGALGPVKECTIQLPTGGAPVTIFAGDAVHDAQGNITSNYSFQTTAYTLAKDTGKPVGTIEYYSNYSNGTKLTQDQYEYWQKQPITAVITCTDKASTSPTGQPVTSGETDGPSCACAQTLSGTQSEVDQWSLGTPSSNTNIGPDIMTYSRVITNNNTALSALKVQDNAHNISDESFSPDFGIDSTPPRLTASKTANSVTLSFTDNHAGASGIWKFTDNIPVATASSPQIYKGGENNAILYRIGSKNNLASLEFGPDCSPLPVKNTNYYKYKEVPAAPLTQTLTLNSFDVNNNVVAYCIQDNAGNINRGYYPNNLTGCFASSNMSTIPTLSPSTLTTHYAPILKARLLSTTLSDNQKYGYSFSENTTDANCFRGILSNNITTLITNQLTARTNTTLSNWDTDKAYNKNTTIQNTNGYYSYTYTSATNNTLSINTSPSGTGTKTVVVEGGNIQINTNIEYLGSNKTLLLVARKNGAGQGGNIYINPTVTRIDAIIIADGGAIMNGTTTTTSTATTTTTQNWITNASSLTNRLTINGRLYSYNTRGGSVTPQVAPGTDFDPLTTNIGKYFNTSATSTNAAQLITTATPTQAASYDLERLRVMLSDGNSQCTTHINYQTFTTSTLPALMVRPSGFSGGNCSF